MNNYWKNKNVLITGASGFVGSNAVKYFYEIGARVTGVILPNTSQKEIERQLGVIKKRIIVKEANLLSPEEAIEAVNGQDIVLNFAAVDGSLEFKNSHSAEVFSKNLRINLNMLEAANVCKVEAFLLVSSTDIYSPQESNMINEDSPIELNWNNNFNGYKLAKWVSELAAKEYAKQYGLDIVIIRPSNLYGPGDDFSDKGKMRFIPSVIMKINKGNTPVILWGDGTQTRSFLYIYDFVQLCKKLIEKKIFNQPVNIASKNHSKLSDIAKLVIRLCRSSADIIIDRQKPGGPHSIILDVNRIQSLIGKYEETSLEIGLEKTIEFYRKHYL